MELKKNLIYNLDGRLDWVESNKFAYRAVFAFLFIILAGSTLNLILNQSEYFGSNIFYIVFVCFALFKIDGYRTRSAEVVVSELKAIIKREDLDKLVEEESAAIFKAVGIYTGTPRGYQLEMDKRKKIKFIQHLAKKKHRESLLDALHQLNQLQSESKKESPH